jgi:hypothetical protein
MLLFFGNSVQGLGFVCGFCIFASSYFLNYYPKNYFNVQDRFVASW